MFSKNLKFLREKNHMEQQELANHLGKKSSSTISEWEKGKYTPRIGVLNDIAELFDVSISDLMNKDLSNQENSNYKTGISKIYDLLDPDRQAKVVNYAQAQLDEQNNIIHIDEYQEIYLQSKVSAGTGILDLDPENVETISYKGKLPNYYDFAFKVAGNSMEPIFFDGDIIFVEKMNDVINGALMVVQIDDEAFIKKVYRENNCLRLVSLNKDYKDIIVDGKNEIRIVGKVVF